jgi:hypothetical protein
MDGDAKYPACWYVALLELGCICCDLEIRYWGINGAGGGGHIPARKWAIEWLRGRMAVLGLPAKCRCQGARHRMSFVGKL